MNARFFHPMLCLAVPKLPEGPDWQLELRLDGYRGIGIKTNGRAPLASRNGKNFSERFPTVMRALNRLPDETVIDGEIVAVNADGVPSFNLLQNGGSEHSILFYAFDLLILAGTDLRARPLEQRRSLLRELIPKLGDPIRHSETFDVPAAEHLKTVRQHGLEGIVAKRRSSTYRAGDHSGDWVKLRANQGQEFVIGGYCAQLEYLRFNPGRLQRGGQPQACGADSKRIRPRFKAACFRPISRFATRRMPSCESP